MNKEIRVGYLVIGMFLALVIGIFAGAIIEYKLETKMPVYKISGPSITDRVCMAVDFRDLDVICHQRGGGTEFSFNVLYPVTVSIIGGDDEGD